MSGKRREEPRSPRPDFEDVSQGVRAPSCQNQETPTFHTTQYIPYIHDDTLPIIPKCVFSITLPLYAIYPSHFENGDQETLSPMGLDQHRQPARCYREDQLRWAPMLRRELECMVSSRSQESITLPTDCPWNGTNYGS